MAGYENSVPVRIGNAAASQIQLHIYGEVADALHQARSGRLKPNQDAWNLQRALTRHLEKIWDIKDEGMWEFRGPSRHFTYSKVMAWMAFDRAVKAIETFGLEGPIERWRAVRDCIHAQVCERGWDREIESFVQSSDSRELDASLLLMPLVGFLPATDRRIRATVAAIEKKLSVDGLLLRYNTGTAEDALYRSNVQISLREWNLNAVFGKYVENIEQEVAFEQLRDSKTLRRPDAQFEIQAAVTECSEDYIRRWVREDFGAQTANLQQ